MSQRLSVSTTIRRAQAIAIRDGWNPAWVRQEVDARAVLEAGCFFDEASAARPVNFFSKVLRHPDTSTGKIGPFALMDWQRDEFLRPLFGWKRKDGTRRYRRFGLWVPKKNGKSTLLAGLNLYLLVGDGEPAAEVYSAANDRRQAGIIHGHALRMVQLSPLLMQRITKKNLIRSTKTITDPVSGSVFIALSADAPTKEGLNIHGLTIDEIHSMINRTLFETLWYGGAARRQSLVGTISTAGVFDVASIGWEQYTYARDLVKGTKDDDWSFFGLIYEADKEDDWSSEDVWRKSNPSFGVTVKADKFREDFTEAKSEPRKQNTFRRYRLNQWVQQATRWIPLSVWAANHKHEVTRDALKGAVSYGGLDIGSVSDLTAFALLCECPHDLEALDVLMRFWLPQDALSDPHNRNATMYRQWAAEGLITPTPGNVTDYDFVEADILKDASEFDIKALGIDRLFQGQQVSNHLTDAGVVVVLVGQGAIGQGPPMKEFERRWRAGNIHHGNHPVLRWMADNVEVKEAPGELLKIVKPNSRMDSRKVDGIAAIVNAIDQVSRAILETPPNYDMFLLGN